MKDWGIHTHRKGAKGLLRDRLIYHMSSRAVHLSPEAGVYLSHWRRRDLRVLWMEEQKEAYLACTQDRGPEAGG